MNRAIFPAVTILLSALVFAAVWTMAGPMPASGTAAVATQAVAAAPAAPPPSASTPPPECNAGPAGCAPHPDI